MAGRFRLAEAAKKTERSMSAYVRFALTEQMKRDGVSPEGPTEQVAPVGRRKKAEAPEALPPMDQRKGYWLVDGFSVGSERPLPVVTRYNGPAGGYIAMYTRDRSKAIYPVGGSIYVVGVVRLEGKYIGRVFHPRGYKNKDISAAQEFKDLCRELFDVDGWAGGDTGGWFGLG